MDTKIGQHYSQIELGSEKTRMSLYLTTGTAMMGIYGVDCTDCDVPSKYNSSSSNSS